MVAVSLPVVSSLTPRPTPRCLMYWCFGDLTKSWHIENTFLQVFFDEYAPEFLAERKSEPSCDQRANDIAVNQRVASSLFVYFDTPLGQVLYCASDPEVLPPSILGAQISLWEVCFYYLDADILYLWKIVSIR